jgi:hypothetical protein
MLIRFETGGGVAGLSARRVCEVDTERLPTEEAAAVKALVMTANLPELARRSHASVQRARADDTYYEIGVQDQGQSHNVSASQLDMPAELRPLVQWLSNRAAPGLGDER